jgi:hypothetical protein
VRLDVAVADSKRVKIGESTEKLCNGGHQSRNRGRRGGKTRTNLVDVELGEDLREVLTLLRVGTVDTVEGFGLERSDGRRAEVSFVNRGKGEGGKGENARRIRGRGSSRPRRSTS